MNKNDSLNTLLVDAARRGIAYRQSCGDRAVAPSEAAVAAVQRLVEPLPEKGRPDEEVLALLDEIGSPASMAMAGPRFFGFVIGVRFRSLSRRTGCAPHGTRMSSCTK